MILLVRVIKIIFHPLPLGDLDQGFFLLLLLLLHGYVTLELLE